MGVGEKESTSFCEQKAPGRRAAKNFISFGSEPF
jgi:hypothetical protein